MLVGYMRVSTSGDRQAVDLQRDALLAAGSMSATCSRIARPEAVATVPAWPRRWRSSGGRLPGGLEAGPLGRSLPHLLTTVTDLKQRGVAFRSLTEQMDTTRRKASCCSTFSGLSRSSSAR